MADEDDDDDTFSALLEDFNALDADDVFEEADGYFLDSISANLREAAGIQKEAHEHTTTWEAPVAHGLENSGLAKDEANDSMKRREVAAQRASAEDMLWDELATTPPRKLTQVESSFPSTQQQAGRRPSTGLVVAASDNLLAAIDAEAKRLVHDMAGRDKENAAAAAGAFDSLANHARAAPRLDKDSLQRVYDDVTATGAEGQDLLRLANFASSQRRERLSPDIARRGGALATQWPAA